MELFAKATKEKYRFESNKGVLGVEDLWDLPLQSERKDSLDSIAKALNRDVKNAEEESFVSTAEKSPERTLAANKLEVVKAVIAERIAENARHATAQARKETKEKILQVLAAKKDESLHQASEEELKAMLAALG